MSDLRVFSTVQHSSTLSLPFGIAQNGSKLSSICKYRSEAVSKFTWSLVMDKSWLVFKKQNSRLSVRGLVVTRNIRNANVALGDAVLRFYQGVLCCQNVTQFHGTRVHSTEFKSVWTAMRRLSHNSHMFNRPMRRINSSNWTINVIETDLNSLMPQNTAQFFLRRIFWESKSVIKVSRTSSIIKCSQIRWQM